jgi:hypothetical protein
VLTWDLGPLRIDVTGSDCNRNRQAHSWGCAFLAVLVALKLLDIKGRHDGGTSMARAKIAKGNRVRGLRNPKNVFASGIIRSRNRKERSLVRLFIIVEAEANANRVNTRIDKSEQVD